MEIPFAKANYGLEEIDAVNRVLNSPLLASGPECEAFEKEFAAYVGSKYAIACNSGSSANLLALACLQLPKSSKVLTSSCGFPATLSPVLHLDLTPILVDYDSATHNIHVADVVQEIQKNKVSAIIFAHTLGNPVDMAPIMFASQQLNIPVIEDCCESLGAKYYGFHVGTHGTLGTYSFYPAHQITAGGMGGMVVTSEEHLYRRMKSLRDWGKMYDWDSGKGGNTTDYSSPIGYHRGYTYETVGWNFKLAEMNCAFGREQLKKADRFAKERLDNWIYLYDRLKHLEEIWIQPYFKGSSPFGFVMDVKEDGGRNKFGAYLESKGIRHRPFFAGNILRQPAFKSDDAWRFRTADYLMNHSLFIGCWAGMTQEMLDYIVENIIAYYRDS